MERLRLTAVPAEGESLPGFLVRLAERAGLPGASAMAALAGLEQPGSTVGAASLLPLAELSGVPAARLEAMAYRPSGVRRHHLFLGGTAHRDFIWLAGRRSCPLCLRLFPCHRRAWDFALSTACLLHRCRLVSACPRCGAEPGWDFPSIRSCPCGARLDLVPAMAVPESEADAMATLHAMVRDGIPPWLHGDFAGCGPSDLLRIVVALGASAVGWEGHRRVASVVRAGSDVTAAIVVAGVRALVDWPHSLREMRQRGCRPPEDRPRRSAALSLLHKLAKRVPNSP